MMTREDSAARLRDCNCHVLALLPEYGPVLTLSELAVAMNVAVSTANKAPGWCSCGRYFGKISLPGSRWRYVQARRSITDLEGIADRPETPRTMRGAHWIDRQHQQAVFVDKLGNAASLSWGLSLDSEKIVLVMSDGALLTDQNVRALADLMAEIADSYRA